MNILRQTIFTQKKELHSGKLICYLCGKEITEKNAVLEHKDNNPKNNAPENLEVACRSCNKKKDPSNIFKLLRNKEVNIEALYSYTQKQTKENNLAIGTVAMARNIHGKNNLKAWLSKRLKKNPVMLLTDFTEAGAEIAGVEMSTIEKWIPPMTSSEGKYAIRTINKLKYIMTKRTAKEYDSDKQGF